MVWVWWMVIKKIQSPFDNGGMLNGDQIVSIPKKGGMSHVFGKPSTKKLQQANCLWQLKKFSCHGYHRGLPNFSFTIQHTPTIEW
jgi:hypothetical protein